MTDQINAEQVAHLEIKKHSKNHTEKTIYSWPLGDKNILWLARHNKYILAENIASKLIELIVETADINVAVQFCMSQLNVEHEQAMRYVNELQQYLNDYLLNEKTPQLKVSSIVTSTTPESRRFYSIYGTSFMVEYCSKEYEQLIHPKFEHLEVGTIENPGHYFQVVGIDEGALLMVDGQPIGAWGHNDSHYLGGKFSMQLLQKIYNNEENDWMAVFHAAGITDGKNCIMFLGDSGNGKSTLSALLMANGYNVLADDFLPVDSCSLMVCHFPSAISVKTNAFELLVSAFPQLKNSKEIHNQTAGKTFRYLPTDRIDQICVPCKALVFVKYEPGSGLLIEDMVHDEAFQHLIPDSWISPEPDNARRFVEWFTQLPCYRLTYSDNTKMIETIKVLFNNGLS
jgi:hypothetical protein